MLPLERSQEVFVLLKSLPSRYFVFVAAAGMDDKNTVVVHCLELLYHGQNSPQVVRRPRQSDLQCSTLRH